MMAPDFQSAFKAGLERLTAWSDVLDAINVFPVADGDTGRNLIISLAPLRVLDPIREITKNKILHDARGNSGNIAAAFFSGLLSAGSYDDLPQAAEVGRAFAWQAVRNPVPGTMLTIFDALAESLKVKTFLDSPECLDRLIDRLEEAVRRTTELVPELKSAGVVDSGALGMFIYLEGFFSCLIGRPNQFRPIKSIFKDRLEIADAYQAEVKQGYCVDTVLRIGGRTDENIRTLSDYADSASVISYGNFAKIHLHTGDASTARAELASLGDVVHWSHENLGDQIKSFKGRRQAAAIHIMTDAAGSITREDALELGLTLLNSYIVAGDKSLPETLFTPSEIYDKLRSGVRVSTSQASTFERQQYYQRVTGQYPKVLYLCVGSVYTGNYETAVHWKERYDREDRLTVIDTTAASGRLGTIVLATARFAAQTDDAEAVIAFACRAVLKCEEYIFLDRLKYLAAGGRLSKTSAFFGDMLNVKPVISPTAEGAKKVGAVMNAAGQIRFALEKLENAGLARTAPLVMLGFSDNRDWVMDTVRQEIEALCPAADVRLQPISLTSGVHFGPGAWTLAFLPETV